MTFTNRSRRRRLAALYFFCAGATTLMALSVSQVWIPALLASLWGALGVGIWREWKPAKLLATIGFAFGLVISVGAGVQLWFAMLKSAEMSLDFFLAVANSLAATALMAWLCFLGIALLADSRRSRLMVTVRVVGAVLVAAAILHLKHAMELDGPTVGFSYKVDPSGMTLVGFPGWQLWHAGALVIGVALLSGWRPLLAYALLALSVIIAVLVPLQAVAVLMFGGGLGVGYVGYSLVVACVPLLPAYLCWWLRQECVQQFAN
jgi:hypothetical protein